MKWPIPFLLTISCATAFAGPAEIEGMPKDARDRLQIELSKRLGKRLEVVGVNGKVADDVRTVHDVQVVNKIEAELDKIKAKKPFAESLKLPPAALSQFEENIAARVELHQIAVSNVPEDKILEVANVSKSDLRQMARQPILDLALINKLSAAFPKEGRQSVQLYNPLTPNDSDQAIVTIPGHFNPSTGRVTQEYPRRRFNIVGVLADISASPSAHICSGTLIADRWFLTATHCLLDQHSNSRFSDQRIAVFLPFLGGNEIVRRADNRENRGLLRVKTIRTLWFGEVSGRAFPTTEFEVDAAIEAGNDVALIELDATNATNGITTGRLNIPQASGVGPPLTLAGYGLTNASNTIGGLLLEVGVRNDLVAPEGTELLRTQGESQSNGHICNGDSGGPIFLGDVKTNIHSQFRLIAIASKISFVWGGGDACAEGVQRFTRVDRTAVRNWLCSTTGTGC